MKTWINFTPLNHSFEIFKIIFLINYKINEYIPIKNNYIFASSIKVDNS